MAGTRIVPSFCGSWAFPDQLLGPIYITVSWCSFDINEDTSHDSSLKQTLKLKKIENLPSSGMETLSPTPKISSIRDVVENPGVCVEDWIDKTDWSLANSESLLVDL